MKTLGKKPGQGEEAGPNTLRVSEPEDALTRELILKLEGMWCSACSWLIESVLRRTLGVVKVEALFASDLVRIKYLPHQVTPEEIQDRISKLGYRPSPFQDPRRLPEKEKGHNCVWEFPPF